MGRCGPGLKSLNCNLNLLSQFPPTLSERHWTGLTSRAILSQLPQAFGLRPFPRPEGFPGRGELPGGCDGAVWGSLFGAASIKR